MSETDPLAPLRQRNTITDPVLRRVYDDRPCWICGSPGLCGHREPELDRAAYSLPAEPDGEQPREAE